MNRLIASLAIVLAIASVFRYDRDVRDRVPAQRFLADFDVAARRPADAATLALVPAADLGANVVADIALSDAVGTVRLADASPDLRARWLRAVEHVDDELLAARNLTLDALADRPGWPAHWTMLGELVYASQRREPRAPKTAEARLWQEPLRIGLSYFPGDDGVATFASTAYLETWPELSPDMRARAAAGFGRALLDPSFSARTFPVLIEATGAEEAITLLPSEPGTLRAAFDSFAQAGDVSRAASVYHRWESAEWEARQAGLREIEDRARLNDVEKLRSLALDWMAHHPATDFDTPAGRAQVMRVLHLTVNDRIGTWQSDPRSGVVRFFLNRRIVPDRRGARGLEIASGGAAIATAVNSLTGVPEPIRARARLLGGDIEGARSMFERSDSAGSFEWTPFLLDLAEFRLMQGSAEDARAALEGLAPAARSECDVLIVRRKIARLGGENETPAIAHGTAMPAWSSSGVLSLCIDPEEGDAQQLAATIESPAPALVSWGWNDGRQGSAYVAAGRTTLRVPLTGHNGRSNFFIRALAGGPITLGATAIQQQ
jgi:hypothetical protein